MEDGGHVATRQDFTDEEWATLQKGLGGSGALVSVSDRDFTDTFGEASALAKYLAAQQVAATSELMRELAKTRGTGFGLTTSPDRMRIETLAALSSSIETLGAKAPEDLGPYRELVLGLAQAVADAKAGETPIETAMIASIREALGAD
jgi:hypothetical protein